MGGFDYFSNFPRLYLFFPFVVQMIITMCDVLALATARRGMLDSFFQNIYAYYIKYKLRKEVFLTDCVRKCNNFYGFVFKTKVVTHSLLASVVLIYVKTLNLLRDSRTN